MLQQPWAGCDGRAWGGAWLGTRGQLRTQTRRSARLGALVVILARGEGVNCCAPPPPSRIARRRPKCAQNYVKGFTFKEYVLYVIGARVIDVDGDCSLGEGVSYLCPPPPRRIARRPPKRA
jgi:hypothetical protein